MADIDKLIQDLQSDNPGKRFQACNELFNTRSIPESALEALREATQDSDPVIANAAQRALNIHTETSKIPHNQLGNEFDQSPMTELNKNNQLSMSLSTRIAIIFGAVVIILFLLYLLYLGQCMTYTTSIIICNKSIQKEILARFSDTSDTFGFITCLAPLFVTALITTVILTMKKSTGLKFIILILAISVICGIATFYILSILYALG